MSELTPKQAHTSSKEVMIDFVLEIIGYEKAMYKTFVDLRKRPQVVLQSYLSKENVYISPFKILFYFVGVWLIVNNLIIDWYKIWNNYMRFLWLTDHNESDIMPQELLHFSKMTVKIAGDLFSKNYMILVIFMTPIWAFFCNLFCKKYKIDFRTHMAVVGYHFSLGFITAFVTIICLAINFWLCLGVGLIIMLSPVVGLRRIYNVFNVVPVSAFFENDGLAIEKKYFRARLIAVFLSLLVYLLVVWAYYTLYPI
jgi:hypothetical protein